MVALLAWWLSSTCFLASRGTSPQLSAPRVRAGPQALATGDDPYSILGVQRDATSSQIKQAYRRLALRNHPDVAQGIDNPEEKFARIAEAYSILSDPSARAKFDRSAGASPTSNYRSSRTTPPPSRSAYTSSASAAAAAERRRRWREENPSPDELGDSFGALFGDIASAVSSAFAGGDWLTLLDEMQLGDGAELDTLLRTSDASTLQEELESARFVKRSLKARIGRLTSEVQAAMDDSATFSRDGLRGSMEKSLAREMQRDLQRRRDRLVRARRLLSQAENREKRISAWLQQVQNGRGRSHSRPQQLPSVDEELAQLKRKMGKG